MRRPIDQERLAEGYRKNTERDRKIAEEFQHVSHEANQYLGPAPDWDEEIVEPIDSDCDDETGTDL